MKFKKVNNKIILVTGASSGLEKEISKISAKTNTTVLLVTEIYIEKINQLDYSREFEKIESYSVH